MAALLFPDNTVLVNFALIDRMDLLERLVNGNGQWCATVASECHASSLRPELAALTEVGAIFGSPLSPDRAEKLDAHLLRDELAGPGDAPHKHLGEAETIAIVLRRGLNAFFVTDDREAQRLAGKNGITTVTTWKLLKTAVIVGFLDADTLWTYVQVLRKSRRGSPPGVHDRPTYDTWLAGT
ncbi:hypothetical protein REH65_19335 [Saccharopolyspora sp. ID03-671]|uniref:hypothetical protein n=1 Tax=Saccharopolyspora sp. ID03-671 TaxID=3073066 RepID=UPI00324ACF03